MKLVSMKLPKSATKEHDDAPTPLENPSFPYGLELRLDREQLEKLGLDPEVGGEVVIEARGTVTMYREMEWQGQKPDCSAEIQITDLAIVPAPDRVREKRRAARLNSISSPTNY